MQERVIAALDYEELVAFDVLGGHIPRRRRRVGDAADLETVPLAERVERQAAMLTPLAARVIADHARRRRQIAAQECFERPFADEANTGAVALVRNGYSHGSRERPHLDLFQVAQRE